MKEVRKVHQMYVECPTEDWVVADGGRCYKRAERREKLEGNVECLRCRKWFGSAWAYEQHWQTVHNV